MGTKFKRILVKIGIVLMIIVTICLVTRTIFNYMTGKKLEKTIEKMKAADKIMKFAEFEPDCRDDDNAALPWKGVEAILQIKPGQRAILSKALKDIFYNELMSEDTRKKIEIMVEKNQRAMLLIQDTGQKPCFKYNEDWNKYGLEMLGPRAIKAIQAFRLYGLDAVIKAGKGRLTEALEQSRIGMQFSRKYLDEPLLINTLVAFAQMRAQILFLNKIADGKEIATETLLDILIELNTEFWRKGLVRSFEVEKILSLETRTRWLRGEYNITGVDVSFWDKIYYWIFRPVLKSDIVWSLDQFSEMEKVAELPYNQTYETRERLIKKQEDIPWLYKWSDFLVPYLETVMFKEARLEADLNAARIGIGCKIYQNREGRFPEKISDLVPDILPEEPLDPFTGKPYIYRLQDDGFIVYSLGSNQKDDNGRGTLEITSIVMEKDDDIAWRETRQK